MGFGSEKPPWKKVSGGVYILTKLYGPVEKMDGWKPHLYLRRRGHIISEQLNHHVKGAKCFLVFIYIKLFKKIKCLNFYLECTVSVNKSYSGASHPSFETSKRFT